MHERQSGVRANEGPVSDGPGEAGEVSDQSVRSASRVSRTSSFKAELVEVRGVHRRHRRDELAILHPRWGSAAAQTQPIRGTYLGPEVALVADGAGEVELRAECEVSVGVPLALLTLAVRVADETELLVAKVAAHSWPRSAEEHPGAAGGSR